MILLLEQDPSIDANLIHPGLWQGSAPAPGDQLQQLGYQVLVLCAEEYQPPAMRFPGVEVHHAPNDDDFSRSPTREELRIALDTSTRVAEAVRAEKKVLVTCMAGRNRSGLVNALALHKLLGISGSQAMGIIQLCRPKALSNPQFQLCLSRIR